MKEWELKILAKYEKVAEFTSLDAKLNYLDYVQEWTFYGATFFIVKQMQFKDYPSPLILGINSEGVLLMEPEKKTMLENYAFTDIVTWGHSDEKFIVVVGNVVQQRKLIFKTVEGKHMNHLIHDYVKFKVKFSSGSKVTFLLYTFLACLTLISREFPCQCTLGVSVYYNLGSSIEWEERDSCS